MSEKLFRELMIILIVTLFVACAPDEPKEETVITEEETTEAPQSTNLPPSIESALSPTHTQTHPNIIANEEVGFYGNKVTEESVLFLRNQPEGNGVELWSINLDGTMERRLIALEQKIFATAGSLSPTGRYYAISMDQKGVLLDLFQGKWQVFDQVQDNSDTLARVDHFLWEENVLYYMQTFVDQQSEKQRYFHFRQVNPPTQPENYLETSLEASDNDYKALSYVPRFTGGDGRFLIYVDVGEVEETDIGAMIWDREMDLLNANLVDPESGQPIAVLDVSGSQILYTYTTYRERIGVANNGLYLASIEAGGVLVDHQRILESQDISDPTCVAAYFIPEDQSVLCNYRSNNNLSIARISPADEEPKEWSVEILVSNNLDNEKMYTLPGRNPFINSHSFFAYENSIRERGIYIMILELEPEITIRRLTQGYAPSFTSGNRQDAP